MCFITIPPVPAFSDKYVGYSVYIHIQHQRLPVWIYCLLHHFTVGLIHSISLFSNEGILNKATVPTYTSPSFAGSTTSALS